MRKIPPGTRLTGPEREKLAVDLKREYDAGASIRQLVEASGRPYGAVHFLLAEVGVEFRPCGAPKVVETIASPTETEPVPILSRIAL
ncbi:helix-turn-helix domain-containing protein [Saccharopolyspora hattusasensis]|uniref:helix-turn-helix domain-containing protein n=1 Tax=Saccharopolyspora hattusasensis TaxID=1128679 RepID=UPI003D955AF2